MPRLAGPLPVSAGRAPYERMGGGGRTRRDGSCPRVRSTVLTRCYQGAGANFSCISAFN